jgi:hypothetical protein
MKERDDDQKGWLSIPDAKLVSGKPNPVKDGHFFKIRNYKTVELQSGNITEPRAFKKASVLVFSSTGELVLEKAYRVQIDVASPEKVPPTQESAPPLQQQEESPSSDTVEEKPALKQNDKENVILEKTQEKDATENADSPATE